MVKLIGDTKTELIIYARILYMASLLEIEAKEDHGNVGLMIGEFIGEQTNTR